MNATPDSDAGEKSGDKISTSRPPEERELTSADLLQGEREIRIRHGDDVYRLRLTRKGKLILQK